MKINIQTKIKLKQKIIESLKTENEIQKIVIFGSFLNSNTPNDIDIAIFQNSKSGYLSLALKYRKLTREISRSIPIDIIPIKSMGNENSFLSEIEAGEIIYER